jgi:hypothetical protein
MKTKQESKRILDIVAQKYKEDNEFISKFIDEVNQYKQYIKLKIELGNQNYEIKNKTTGDIYNVKYIYVEVPNEYILCINKVINTIEIQIGKINLSQQTYETTRLIKFVELLKIYKDQIHDDFASSLEEYITRLEEIKND